MLLKQGLKNMAAASLESPSLDAVQRESARDRQGCQEEEQMLRCGVAVLQCKPASVGELFGMDYSHSAQPRARPPEDSLLKLSASYNLGSMNAPVN